MSLTLFSLYIGYLSKSSDISSMFSPSRAGQIKCDISIDDDVKCQTLTVNQS